MGDGGARMTLQLEELPFELDGKTYLLRCNMAVLETIQEAHDGDFGAVLNAPVNESALEFLAAMLNDYAWEQGWPELWYPEQLKRRVSLAMLTQIFKLVTRSIMAPAPDADQAPGHPGN